VARLLGRTDVAMDAFLMWRLQMEVNRQCKFALKTLDDMGLGSEDDNENFWYSMQAFLSAVANVSKLLWGSGTSNQQRLEAEERRRPLRETLDVAEDSPLRARAFRNHFDHFDERLEKQFNDWAAGGYQGGISDTFVGDIDDLDIGHLALRNFDTTTKTLTFRGEKLPLAPLFAHLSLLEEEAVNAVCGYLLENALPVDEWDDDL
jgi:hypothetical protein